MFVCLVIINKNYTSPIMLSPRFLMAEWIISRNDLALLLRGLQPGHLLTIALVTGSGRVFYTLDIHYRYLEEHLTSAGKLAQLSRNALKISGRARC